MRPVSRILTVVNRAENPAKTISFTWAPLVYPVRWAETPEEVPEWDVSRGCPWHEWRPHERPPPPGIKPSPYPNWEVRPPPESGYPRLVRQSLKDQVRPRSRTRHDIISELAPLYRYVEAWRCGKPVKVLKKKVLTLAGVYGAPDSDYEDTTLEAWLKVIAYVHTHVSALRDLQVNGYELTAPKLLKQKAELDAKKYRDTDAEHQRPPPNDVGPNGEKLITVTAPIYRNERDAIQESEHFALLQLCGAVKDADAKPARYPESNSTTAFRLAVAKSLYNTGFGASIGRGKNEYVTFSGFGVLVRCSVRRWVKYKLAEMWRLGAEVKTCPVCNTSRPRIAA